jgi:hypothetical protein
MAILNNCGVCNQSFESDRDLQEHQQGAHPERRDSKLPDSEEGHREGPQEREKIA